MFSVHPFHIRGVESKITNTVIGVRFHENEIVGVEENKSVDKNPWR